MKDNIYITTRYSVITSLHNRSLFVANVTALLSYALNRHLASLQSDLDQIR